MKTNILKIFAIAALMIFVGAGVSMAGGWKEYGGKRGNAYGHYKDRQYNHYEYCAPRPVYVEHHYRPVVVERHVYHPPVVYQAPAPSGYFLGMSVVEQGMAFSFGMSGH
jgi:NAD-dependent SIR2 family protein deacetylase